jgi:8-oxo-dGTP pyrophosphatase MutT (NUDIX family)
MADPSSIPRETSVGSRAGEPHASTGSRAGEPQASTGSRAGEPQASTGARAGQPLASTLEMALIRQRLAGHVPRSAEVDPIFGQLLLDAPELPSRRAAVATILRDHPQLGPEVLFIRRAEHPHDPWSGHMAFPGGREEPSDADLLQTAIRETREEVSLDLAENAVLLGRLDELPAMARGRPTGLTVAPFVFELTHDAPLHFNGEVSEIVWAPLAQLFHGEHTRVFTHEIEGQSIELPAHDVQGRIVWGLTHRMLENLFALLR